MENLERYLREKNVEALLSNLVFEICLEQPNDIKKFIINYLQHDFAACERGSGGTTSTSPRNRGVCKCCEHQGPIRSEPGRVPVGYNFQPRETNQQPIYSTFSPQPVETHDEGRRFTFPTEENKQTWGHPTAFQLPNKGTTVKPKKDVQQEKTQQPKPAYNREERPLEEEEVEGEEQSKVDFVNLDSALERRLSSYTMLSPPSASDNKKKNCEEGLSEVSVIDDMKSLERLRKYSISIQPNRRKSVVGDSISVEDLVDFDPPKYPKSEESNRFLEECLRHNVLFRSLDSSELEKVFDAMKELHFKKGDVLITQGDDGDYFYVLKVGICNIYIRHPDHDGYGKLVKVCKKYDCFGELALMYNQPRAATVVAMGDVTTFAIDRMTFRKLMMDQTMKKRKRYVSFLNAVPILEPLTEYEKKKIADALEPVSFFQGDVIIREGEVGNKFYIIEFGEVDVLKRKTNYNGDEDGRPVGDGGEEEVVAQLGKEAYFGELALLHDCKRQASCVAKTEFVKCVSLSRNRFDRLLGPCIEIMKRNEENYKLYVKKK